MNIENISTEVERERRTVRVVKLYEKGLSDEEYDIRENTAKGLQALASAIPDRFVELYKKGLADDDNVVRGETARTLSALANSLPKEFIELFETGFKSKCSWIRHITVKELLTAVKPQIAN